MKVLIVTNLFPLPSDPTRGIFNFEQFSRLPDDLELLVLVPVPWRLWRSEFATVRTFKDVRVHYFRFVYPPRIALGMHHRWQWWSLRASGLADIDEFAPECVLGSFLYPDGSLAARLSDRYDVPLLLKAHGSDVNLKAVDRRFEAQIRKSVARAAALVAVCDSLADRIREIGLPARQVRVIENGIDLDMFSIRDRELSRRNLQLDADVRLVLYVGNLKQDKGCLDLFDAATEFLLRVPRSMLLYVGDGESAPQLRSRIAQAGLQDKVRLLGKKPHELVPLFLGAADVLALPSYAEGLPNVVLEAFASGRPVVGTDVGAIPSLLAGGGGEIVRPRDPKALADAIVRVLESPYDERQLRQRTVSRSWAASAEALAALIRETRSPSPQ